MIFWPCSIGVEVYQTSLPSAFALATSTASCACAETMRLDRATRVAAASAFFAIGMRNLPSVVAGLSWPVRSRRLGSAPGQGFDRQAPWTDLPAFVTQPLASANLS